MPDPIALQSERYDRATIWLHWLTAALVLALWCLGETIDWFPRGDARVYARSTHIALGTLLALLLIVRVAWRATRGRRLPAAELGRLRWAARAVHWLLYLLVAGAVLFGLANVWVRGDAIFNLFRVPAFDAGNRALRAQIGDWHETLANALLYLGVLHAAAGLWHYAVRKDRVLARMGIGR